MKTVHWGGLHFSFSLCRDSKDRPERSEGKKQSGGLFLRSWENPLIDGRILYGCGYQSILFIHRNPIITLRPHRNTQHPLWMLGVSVHLSANSFKIEKQLLSCRFGKFSAIRSSSKTFPKMPVRNGNRQRKCRQDAGSAVQYNFQLGDSVPLRE